MLPTYVIAGTVRSGTTSLHRLLRQHPDVFVSSAKELHFFDHNFARGVAWYAEWFADAAPGQAAGEASPNYLYDPHAVPRMAQVIPRAHVIVLMRNPVDRAYSHYWMHRTSGRETLGFEAALERERNGGDDWDDTTRSTFGYLDRGRYLEQLQRLQEYYPPEQTLILLYESLRDHPAEVYARACAFVGVGTDFHPNRMDDRANQHREFRSDRVRAWSGRLRAQGRAGRVAAHLMATMNSRPTRYPPMRAATRHDLEEEFAEPNAALAAWLGRDLSEWRVTHGVPGPGASGV